MKKYISLLFVALLAFTSCEEDLVVYDSENGQTAVSFGATSYNVSIPSEGLPIQIPVNVTTKSESERTFSVTVDDSTVGGAANYSVGQVTVPAGSYNGVLDVVINFDPLVDGEVYTLALNLTAPQDGSVYNESVTIEYFKEIICNDFVVTIITDLYGEETSWEITNESDVVVASGGPYVRGRGLEYTSDVYLEDGCYTFTIFDAYADGQTDGSFDGSYSVSCSILNVASGSGGFGASESTEFCVNQ